MVRYFVIALFVTLYHFPAFGECGPQNYGSEDEPNFECPSPGEEDLVPDLDPPPSIPVQEGDLIEAEWDGALVHKDRLIYMGLRIRAIRRLRWLDNLECVERREIENGHAESILTLNRQYCEQRVDHYRDRAVQAMDRASSSNAWYRSFGFGLTLGLVISAVLVSLAAYVVTTI